MRLVHGPLVISWLPITSKLSESFNPTTQVQYTLAVSAQVTLEVFNSLGQKVMEWNSQKSAGYHTEIFDATRLSSGVYFYKLTTPSFTDTKRMLLIK